MTNDVAGGKAVVAGASVLTAVMSWLPAIEGFLRVACSVLAFISGLIVVVPAIRRKIRHWNRKRK